MSPTDRAKRTGVVDSWEGQSGALSAQKIDPVSATILVDTGQLPAGYYDIHFSVAASAAHYAFYLEHRNAANTTDKGVIVGGVLANGCLQGRFINRKVLSNERFRIYTHTDATGTFFGCINWTRRT